MLMWHAACGEAGDPSDAQHGILLGGAGLTTALCDGLPTAAEVHHRHLARSMHLLQTPSCRVPVRADSRTECLLRPFLYFPHTPALPATCKWSGGRH